MSKGGKKQKRSLAKRISDTWSDWEGSVRTATRFTLVCGLIAGVYFVYRIVLLAYPAVVLGQSIANPVGDVAMVCSEEEGSKLPDPIPVISKAYQKRIQSEQPLGPNMIVDFNVTQTDPVTDGPAGYSHNVDNSQSVYSWVPGAGDDAYLHVDDMNPDTSATRTAPAWLPDSVPVQHERTYAYSFMHRSSVPLQVALQYTTAAGVQGYIAVTQLAAASDWQVFAAHFDNSIDAAQLRVIVSATAPGSIDTKSYDIHEIRNAQLSKGIVSVTFDDGWRSAYEQALPLLEKYKIRSTQYIISDVSAHNVPGYMNWGAVRVMKQAGQEIGSHSMHHCNQTELKQSDISYNAAQSKKQLETQSLGPIQSFAYPLGQYNTTSQAVYSTQFPLIRTSDFGYNDQYYDETRILSIGVTSSTTDATFASWLAYAKTHHLWAVLVYHRVGETGEYNVSPQQLERQFQMIQKSGLKVMPLGEAAREARKANG